MPKTPCKTALSAALLGALTIAAPKPAMASSSPFVGEIMIFAGNFCPVGWANADGQLLAVSQHDALFSLYGTMYGGDGRTTFALPDLRGRTPIHAGTGPGLPTYNVGSRGGSTSYTVGINNLPAHSHAVNATNARPDKHGPGTDFLAPAYYQDGSNLNIYHEGPANRAMDPAVIGYNGGSQPVEKRSPGLGMQICISLFGVYPSRN